MEEQRRLLYVGITRAMDRLTLSCVRHRPGRDELDDRSTARLGCDHLHRQLAIPVVDTLKPPALGRLGVGELDHTLPAYRFLGGIGDIADALLDAATDQPEAAADIGDDDGNERHHREGEQGQLPVQPQHPADQGDDRQGGTARNSGCQCPCKHRRKVGLKYSTYEPIYLW